MDWNLIATIGFTCLGVVGLLIILLKAPKGTSQENDTR